MRNWAYVQFVHAPIHINMWLSPLQFTILVIFELHEIPYEKLHKWLDSYNYVLKKWLDFICTQVDVHQLIPCFLNFCSTIKFNPYLRTFEFLIFIIKAIGFIVASTSLV